MSTVANVWYNNIGSILKINRDRARFRAFTDNMQIYEEIENETMLLFYHYSNLSSVVL